MITIEKLISYIDMYIKALVAIREKQLKVFNENPLYENDVNEIAIWNNALALYCVEEQYTAILKNGLSLLSDSRQHNWIKIGKQTRKNLYETLLNPVLINFDEKNVIQSLDRLLEDMTTGTFLKEISRLQQKFSREEDILDTVLFLGIFFFVMGSIFGTLLHSLPLLLCAVVIPLGLSVIFLLSGFVSAASSNSITEGPSPIIFKGKIAERFSSLEQAVINQASTFSKNDLSFSSSISTTPGRTLMVNPPPKFENRQSRIELNKIFTESKLLFLSSSENNPSKTLKEAVKEEFFQRLGTN